MRNQEMKSFNKIFLLLIMSFLVSAHCFSGLSWVMAEATPDLSNGGGGDWTTGYYRAISITNSTSSAFTDYQIKVTLTTATLGNPYSHIKSDGSDIRFVQSDEVTEIPYWLESFSNTETSIIWVKIPRLPVGDSYIYMYYGNISATSSSNGDNTFEFFDDFEGISLDKNKWNTYGDSITQENGVLKLGYSDTSNNYIISKKFTTTDGIVEWRSKTANTKGQGEAVVFIRSSVNSGEGTAGTVMFHPFNTGDEAGAWSHAIAIHDPIGVENNLPYNTYKCFRGIYYKENYIFKRFSDGWVKEEASGSYTSAEGNKNGFVGLRGCLGRNHWCDWFRIRKYVSSESTVFELGIEKPVTNYILLTNPIILINGTLGVKAGQTIPHLKFNLQLVNNANPKQNTAHWKRLRIDKYIPPQYAPIAIPDDKIEISVWVETNNNDSFDSKDTLISKGKFVDAKIQLDMKRYEITMAPQTFYIVCEILQNNIPGQRIGLEIKESGYLEFEESDIKVSEQNF